MQFHYEYTELYAERFMIQTRPRLFEINLLRCDHVYSSTLSTHPFIFSFMVKSPSPPKEGMKNSLVKGMTKGVGKPNRFVAVQECDATKVQ